MKLTRRLGLAIATAFFLFGGSGATLAQSDLPRQTAETFINDMIATSRLNDRARMTAFLRERVDTSYAFDVAFAPVTDVVSGGQRERLSNLILAFIAGEALVLADAAGSGEMRFDTTSNTEAGTLIQGTYRDGAGEYPFNVLVSSELRNGRLLIKDMGSPRVSTVVTRLAYATTSLAQATPDANVWITAFERALAE